MPMGSEHRQADEDVERAARPIGQQDQRGGHRPGDDQADGDQAELEPADTHAASLADGRPDEPRRKYPRTPRVGPPGHRTDAPPGGGCRQCTGPRRTRRPSGTEGNTWVMAGQPQRGSRGRGRSPRRGSSGPSGALPPSAGGRGRAVPRRHADDHDALGPATDAADGRPTAWSPGRPIDSSSRRAWPRMRPPT